MAYDSKVYNVITDRIIAMLEEGIVPWRKPWNGAEGMPRNLVSKRPYRGLNPFVLSIQPFSSPFWLSYKQVKQLGGVIKDDELKKYTPVIFWKYFDEPRKSKKKDNGGDEDKEEEEDLNDIADLPTTGPRTFYRRPYVRYYNVWNVEQCEGLDDHLPKAKPEIEFTPIAACEQVIANMPEEANIIYKGARACYVPTLDEIWIPKAEIFHSIEEFYSTEFHELGHWTGHSSRLNRKGIEEPHFYGDEIYSQEELVAEMCATFLCSMTGIEQQTIENSKNYIGNWLKKLKNDPKLVVFAGAQAQRACDFIMNVKHTGGDTNA